MKKILLFAFGILWLNSASADIPIGYYYTANGLTDDALKSALHNIIDGHTVKTYGDARYILNNSDQDPDNSGNLILIYTGSSISGNWDSGVTWNREHIWSKSHGFPDEGDDIAYSDLHNLKPSHPTVNTDRSDKDFDEGETQHGIATECYYTSTTWEPRDEVKGDVARIMFYMAVRYQGDVTGESDLELVDVITSYPNPEFGILSTLLQWHIDDPVDNFERNRNEVIFSHQDNRNPFIDHPEYVSKIWGGASSYLTPVITGVAASPEIPTATETVSVSATITDDGSVTSAELHWGLISGALINTITLTNTSGDSYATSSDIPAQTDGTTVYYEIEASDDSSGITISEEYYYTVDNNPPTVILDEDFTSCPVSGWTNYSISGSKNWECNDYGYLSINAYGGTGACDDWFISPSINLDSYNGEYLTFISWTRYTDTYYPPVKLKYSTNYPGNGDPSLSSWTDLSATWSAEDSQTWENSGEIDLSDISGTDVYIAFQYTSSGTASGTSTTWEIDNIFLTEFTNNLPEISNISNSPATPGAGEDVTVTATITDSDGTVSSANIKWGTSSESYPNSVSMSNTDANYSGIIPVQAEGTFVYYIIEATDNSTEVRQSREKGFSYNTASNSVPTITNIVLAPKAPTSTDGVTVSATITDTDGTISVAQMKWGISSSVYEYTVELIKTDDTYSGYIPARAEDTEIYFVIYAADNDGGSVQTSENDYIVNNPPVISTILIDPENPTQNDDVIVSASISDKNGTIESVVLKWKTSSGSYTDVTMSVSDNKYKGVIPKQEVGENISFSIIATDNYGGETSYTSGYYEVSDDVNGISDISENEVSFYPNPASNELNIEVKNYTEELEVQIFNIIGNLVYNEKTNMNNNHKISLVQLESGIYFVKIIYGINHITKKILVKKE